MFWFVLRIVSNNGKSWSPNKIRARFGFAGSCERLRIFCSNICTTLSTTRPGPVCRGYVYPKVNRLHDITRSLRATNGTSLPLNHDTVVVTHNDVFLHEAIR